MLSKKLIILLATFVSCAVYPLKAFCGRPLVVDDAIPVSSGHLELELGFAYGRPHGGSREHRLPVLALAYGIFRNLELGLSIQRVDMDAPRERPPKGFEDLHLSTKLRFVEEDPISLAFAFDLKVPTASRRRGLSSGRFDELFLFLFTKEFRTIALDLNGGYLLVDSPAGEKLENRILGGTAIRWAMHGKWVLVGEIFGRSRETSGEKNEALFQVGLRYLGTSPLVLDAAVGRSLRSTGASIQATLGLTWSFPVNF